MDPNEWQVRVELAALYRLVALNGWDDLIFTHISARLPGPDHRFLINPLGTMFEEITASSLVEVDLSGQVVSPPGATINAAGFTIHSAIHAARSDAIYILHLHTVDGMAVAAQLDGLLPLNQAALTILPTLAYHDYEGIALDLGECERIIADLGSHKAMILRHHGTLATGRSAGEAWTNIYYLERACALQNRALACGQQNVTLAPAAAQATVMAQVSRMTADTSGYDLVWDALVRKLHRTCPGFDT